MRILHIVTAFKRDKKDIITPWLNNLLMHQSQKHNIYVLTSAYKNIQRKQKYGNIKIYRFQYAPKKMQKISHDTTIINYIKKSPLYGLLLIPFFICGIIETIKIIKGEHIDIVNIHWPFPMALLIFPSYFLFNIKTVFTWYGAEFKVFSKDTINKNIIALLSIVADKHIAISSFTANSLKEFINIKNIDIIPYGINIPQLKDYKKEKYILFVGRLVERKGVEYLIKAMQYVDKEYVLKIVGGGDLYNELRNTVNILNLNNRIFLLGKVSDRLLKQLYQNAYIFALPAIYDKKGDTEGLGMVLAEAISYGTPVIATGIGGIIDIVKDNKTGLFINEKDPEDIAKKINILIEDRELYKQLRNNAYIHIKNNFSIENVNKKYMEIYETIQ